MPFSLPLHPTPSDWSALLSRIAGAFDCLTATLHRLDPSDQQLKLVAYQGIPPQIMPMIQSIPVGKGIAGAAAERQEPVELCNLQTDTSGVAKPAARQTHVQGSLAVPVMDGDRLCGTLGIGKIVPYDFSEDEKVRLMHMAADVATRLLPAI